MPEEEIGKVAHFFSKISVAVVELTGDIKIGDTLHFRGATSDFTQKLDSMQIDHKPVEEAKAGDAIGLKTDEPVRENDAVFKVTE